MAKRLTSPYQPGIRSKDWIKIKKQVTFDLVVGGYIPGHGQRSLLWRAPIGSLRLGQIDLYGKGRLWILKARVGGDFQRIHSVR